MRPNGIQVTRDQNGLSGTRRACDQTIPEPVAARHPHHIPSRLGQPLLRQIHQAIDGGGVGGRGFNPDPGREFGE